MDKKQLPNKFTDLRAEAEKRVRFETVPLHRMSEADVASLIREQRVQQIQLEMQNEQLRRAQLELEQSRRKYADLFDFAPIGHFVFDEKDCIVEVNLAGASMLQANRRDLIGKPFCSFLAASEQATFRRHRQRVLETGQPQQCIVRLQRPSGRDRIISLRSQTVTEVLEDTEIEIPYCRTGAIDVTEQERAEQSPREAHTTRKARTTERTTLLRKTVDVLQEEVAEKIETQKRLEQHSEMLQKIIDNIPVMLCFYDREGGVRLINAELRKVLGYALEDFQSNNVMELCYPDPVYRKEVWDYMVAAPPGWRDLFVRNKAGRKVASSWANVRLSDGSYLGIGIDIRRRKRDQNRIRESEERYRTLVELSPDGIAVECEGILLFVNATACKLLGAEKVDDLTGRPMLDLVHPEDRSRTKRQLEFLHHRRKSLRVVETKLVRLNGKALNVALSAIPIAYRSKPATQIVIRDITRRKMAEARLRDNAIQLHQQAELLNLAHDAIMVNNMEGRIILWNRGAERTYGWTKDEALGRIAHELLRTRFPRSLVDISAGLLKEGQWNGELTHATRTGRTLVVSSRWALQRDRDGIPQAILEIERDITQRKRAEQATAEARRFAESILDTVQEALVVLDAKLTVLSANRAFYKTFKVAREETVGRTIYEIGNHQWDLPKLRSLLEDILPQNTSFEDLEVEQDFEHIGHRVMRLNARRIHRDEQKTEMILLAIQDVTVRKQQEQEIHENHRQLAELTEELLLTEERERRHIASALHDSIGQSLAFSKRELGVLRKDLPEALLEKLDRAKQQIDEAVQRTRSLTFELSPSTLYTFGLEAAIDELAEQFSQQEGFQCHLDVQDGDEPLSEQTKVLLYRATRELLINVAKHAEANNVFISVRRINGNVRIEVEDDGKGFDVAKTQSPQGKPVTFGVFSLRQRLTCKNGSFTIRSAPDEGTTVTMQLPLETTDQNDTRSTPS